MRDRIRQSAIIGSIEYYLEQNVINTKSISVKAIKNMMSAAYLIGQLE